MTADYEHARDQMSAKAVRMLAQIGSDRATQHFLGWIDALTIAVFAANGGSGRGGIGLAFDNTKPTQDGGIAA